MPINTGKRGKNLPEEQTQVSAGPSPASAAAAATVDRQQGERGRVELFLSVRWWVQLFLGRVGWRRLEVLSGAI